MSLAAKLPFRHPYAAGFPGLGSQAVPTDADALDYLDRMAAADGASVEVGVATAVDAFVRDSKALGVWDSIRASCVLAGARTLAGALVPLKNEGPELWDMENVPTPTILDGDGSAGAWDAATLTFSNENSSGNATRPRFTFPVSTTSGKSYYISGRFSGDYTAVSRVSLGTADGATTFVDGVFSGTALDASGTLSIYLNGTLGPSSVTIESLSIREVIAAPTNVADGFVEGDYSRTSGLKGDGTSYIDSGRAGDDDPLEDHHQACYATETSAAVTHTKMGALDSGTGGYELVRAADRAYFYSRSSSSFFTSTGIGNQVGFYGYSRTGATLDSRAIDTDYTATRAAVGSAGINIFVFGYNNGGTLTEASQGRLAFYSIGTSLSLADLDIAVTNLLTRMKFALLTGENPAPYDINTLDYVVRGYENGGTLE